MKAVVTIQKSFDEERRFSKDWEFDDFKEFFADEGSYLDRLSDVLKCRGNDGDNFTVTYIVTVTR